MQVLLLLAIATTASAHTVNWDGIPLSEHARSKLYDCMMAFNDPGDIVTYAQLVRSLCIDASSQEKSVLMVADLIVKRYAHTPGLLGREYQNFQAVPQPVIGNKSPYDYLQGYEYAKEFRQPEDIVAFGEIMGAATAHVGHFPHTVAAQIMDMFKDTPGSLWELYKDTQMDSHLAVVRLVSMGVDFTHTQAGSR